MLTVLVLSRPDLGGLVHFDLLVEDLAAICAFATSVGEHWKAVKNLAEHRIAVAEDMTTWERIQECVLESLEEAKKSGCVIGALFSLAALLHVSGKFGARPGCTTLKLKYNTNRISSLGLIK